VDSPVRVRISAVPPESVHPGLVHTGTVRSSSFATWLLIVGFIAATLLALWAGRAGLLKYLYPVAALAIGLVLYRSQRAFYVGYAWWLWFLTPLVRRLVDYQAGYDSINPVLAAPVVVTGLSLLSLLRHLPKLKRHSLAALLPILASLIYAYPIGVHNTGVQAATFSLLQWLVPIAFGFHLATDPQHYLAYQATTRRVFTWAALVLGLYGVWQFISPLPWDRYWMLNTDMVTIGQPLPLEVRVFSTVNSPTPFAMVMLAGLLMLLPTRAAVHVLVGIPAYLAFLLTLVRTAWGGWVLGVGVYATYLRSPARLRLFTVVGLLAVVVGTLTASPLGERIERRFASFSILGEDKSLAVREASAAVVLGLILDEPLGRGLGATGSAKRLAAGGTESFDNGLLNLFFSLGWLGGLLYLGGTIVLLAGLMIRFEPRNDPIPKVARAVSFATFAALASLNTLIGVSGVMFWGFVGLSLSARSWYREADLAAQPGVPRHTGARRQA
jgi:hypothetical protein